MEKGLNPGSWPESGLELYSRTHTRGAEAAPLAAGGRGAIVPPLDTD